MYFGNGDGLMEYDGASFRIIEMSDKNTVRSMAIDNSEIIYIGAVSYFGYLKTDSVGKTIFVNLIDKLSEKGKDFTDVNGVITTKDAVFFTLQKTF
jgi:hypothetical protein